MMTLNQKALKADRKANEVKGESKISTTLVHQDPAQIFTEEVMTPTMIIHPQSLTSKEEV